MKDIYELLNELDLKGNEYEEVYTCDLEKERLKKGLQDKINKKKNRYKKGAIAAAMVGIVAFASIITIEPSLAREIPIIGDLMFRNYNMLNEEYSNYLEVLGTTKSHGGIDVTFENVVADDNVLLLSYIVKNNSNKLNDENSSDALLIGHSIDINGKDYGLAAGADWEFIDNNTIRVLKEIHWGEVKLPNKLDIKVNIDNLFGIRGNWSTEFAIDKSVQSEKTKVIKIDKKINLQNEDIKVEKVVVSPLTVRVEGKGKILPDYIAIDNNGEILKWKQSFQDGETGKNCRNESIYIANENMESIKFIPVERNNSNINRLEGIEVDLKNKSKLTLNIDESRDIVINDIIADSGLLFVKYDSMYKDKVYRGLYSENIYVEVNGEILEETNDYDLDIYNKYIGTDCISIFKVDDIKEIKIGAYDGSNIKISEEKAFTIELNN